MVDPYVEAAEAYMDRNPKRFRPRTAPRKPADRLQLGPVPTRPPITPIGLARALSQPDLACDLSDESLGLTNGARDPITGQVDWSLVR